MNQPKPFPKTEQKVLTVIIDEDGNLLYLKTSEDDIFADMGEVITKRASHVEPDNFWLRVAFRFLRMFGDKTRVAEWTRGWKCLWIVDTRPVGGPVLTWGDVDNWRAVAFGVADETAKWSNRQQAIDAEIVYLNQFFLERGVQ
jgi:hypothetical protein